MLYLKWESPQTTDTKKSEEEITTKCYCGCLGISGWHCGNRYWKKEKNKRKENTQHVPMTSPNTA